MNEPYFAETVSISRATPTGGNHSYFCRSEKKVKPSLPAARAASPTFLVHTVSNAHVNCTRHFVTTHGARGSGPDTNSAGKSRDVTASAADELRIRG